MGAPLGNANGRNARIFRDSLNKILVTYKSDERNVKRGQALDMINIGIVEQALDGKEWACQMIANRTDGKPVQVQEIAIGITARFVVEQYRAELGNDDDVRIMLKTAGALNLLPVLEQLILETIRPEHETIEHAQLEHQPA